MIQCSLRCHLGAGAQLSNATVGLRIPTIQTVTVILPTPIDPSGRPLRSPCSSGAKRLRFFISPERHAAFGAFGCTQSKLNNSRPRTSD